jgi:radical SAM-linked protein
MDGIRAGKTHGSGERYRWAFAYSVTGDVRFISHHDTLRLFRRALARASLPVRFSEGFNPHPRIMIPLPRPVGVASDVELLVVEFEREIDADDALGRLQRHTPSGIRILEARRLRSGERLEVQSVAYRLERGADSPADLDARIYRALESDVIVVARADHKDGGVRSIDVRPYLVDMRLGGDAVEFVLRVTEGGTAKPAEIAGLLGYDPDSINHRIRRIEVQWR